ALEPGAEEGAEEVDGLRAVAADPGGVDGLVVLVDEHHHLVAVVELEPAGEVEEGPLEDRPSGSEIEGGAEMGVVAVAEVIAVEEVTVLLEEGADFVLDDLPGEVPRVGLHVLEGEEDDRVALEVGANAVACAPDGEVGEEAGEVLVALLEE